MQEYIYFFFGNVNIVFGITVALVFQGQYFFEVVWTPSATKQEAKNS